MNRVRDGALIAVLAVVLAWQSPGAIAAAPTAAERAQVRAAEAAIRKAGNFYRAKRYREAGEAANEAVEALAGLPEGSKELAALTAPLEKQIGKARELLAGQGVAVSSGKMAAGDAADKVSFTGDVAPLLVAKCGGCHVQRARGDFSMENYAALIKGSPAGVVVMAGDASGSRLIELVESGDMPRGGGRLTDAEIMLLKNWIDGGAKFDGDNPSVSLAMLAASAMPGMMAEMVPLKRAGKGDEVLFARDIGPVLLAQCVECHGDQNPRSNFSVSDFNRFLRGGDSGAVVVPGKPADSLLVKKLRGMGGGQRMPAGRDPLEEKTIALVEKWIELGARFDGTDPAMTLSDTVAQLAAQRMSHEELAKRRVERSGEIWQLILPDVESRREESANVIVVGGVASPTLVQVAKTAEEQVGQLQKQWGLAAGEPLIKGRLMLFVFDKRYDYGEVGTMLERRELPLEWRGHWAYNALDAYGCVLLPQNRQVPAGVVAQQLAGSYVASLGSVPRWFAEGSGRAMAARFDRKDDRVTSWDAQLMEILASTDKPEEFLAGGLPAEQADVLSYGFVSKMLMSPMSRYAAMVRALREGMMFDEAFEKFYKAPPEELVPGWIARTAKKR